MRMLNLMKPLIYPEGYVIIRRRKKPTGLYLILDGEVKVYYRSTQSTLLYLDIGHDLGDF